MSTVFDFLGYVLLGVEILALIASVIVLVVCAAMLQYHDKNRREG